MKIDQRHWTRRDGWNDAGRDGEDRDAHLVFVFGGRQDLQDPQWLNRIRERSPRARVVSASTAGEIRGTEVHDDTIVSTAIEFAASDVRTTSTRVTNAAESGAAGQRLARALPHPGLRHVLVLADGIRVNGSELARGLRDNVPAGVVVTGGLAGDGARMERTVVGLDGAPEEGQIVAVGFYGARLSIGYGSLGGWDPFGPERLITRSEGNVLHELDGQNALELYKVYLGEHASGLPWTGLLFPLAIRMPDRPETLVRTIVGIDETAHTMTFAGGVPQGAYARLMKANFDRLIEGAAGAARGCARAMSASAPELALLISCVGRKQILKQRVEEEVEAVRDVLGPSTALAGFYSYGEICPHLASAKCELHNQTMTITTFRET